MTVSERDQPDQSISELTRRNILDVIRIENIPWSGRLSETDFLSRLYNLDGLPSHDNRFRSAKDDIWQHRERNPDDWPDDWVFADPRFDLIDAPDETFLRFLCEMVHPVVCPGVSSVEHLVTMFNQHLAADGWEIVTKAQISGKPVFAPRRRVLEGSAALGAVKALAYNLNADYLNQQITRMEAAVGSDPELAIGTAKEFVETICKTILCDCGEPVTDNVDLLQLVKQVRRRLDLLPDNIPEKAKGAKTVKRILSNLGSVAQGLAELRGLYGSGHGKNARVHGLQQRHARLTVGAAITLGVFLFETYQQREGGERGLS